MFVTAETLRALQIFRPDLRQSPGRGAGPEKDGKAAQDARSVFSLFHSLALTSQGRGRLREIFIRPSIDLAVIDARHQSISCLMHSDNEAVVVAIRASLKRVKNIRPMLLHLRRGIFLPGKFSSVKQSAWANLQDFCSNVLQILHVGRETLHSRCDIVNEVRVGMYVQGPRRKHFNLSLVRLTENAAQALCTVDPEAIFQVRETLVRRIDFQRSKSSGRNVVARGVNPELDTLKSTYSNLQAHLEDICLDYRSRLSDEAQSDIVGCIFHPQMGYLLVAAAILQTRIANNQGLSIIDDESGFDAWEEVLLEDGLVYFKTAELSDIDAEFGDLAGRIIGML